MKPGIHPNYREVVFQDLTSGFTFLTRSTAETRDTINYEGKDYPLIKVEISSQSHPFYTGKQATALSTAGQIDKFNRRYQRG
ncbi:MAG: type B 50S ribosomal protein L31 [Thiofilum sp.]|uniref:type B 50S ribosomal protein L31 n=1 Tax=Thiofilum sp. TaxID=2212733 RepID=UPI0025D97575|nr:type B 50S ribosomal protein L31 [Thiofilum sp.]MBK8452813.1 type B 50S ribosomal protein L31 [Thiofilum sp.]